VFKDGSYSVYINNNIFSTIYVNNNLSKTVSSTYYGKNTIKIEIAEQKLTNMAFATLKPVNS
jgi:hypothetical protein